MASLADWIKSQTADYGQLKEAYPNAIKFGSALKKGISDLVPTTEELQNPTAMSERAINYLNPMAGTMGIAKNLNSSLLSKHLSGQKLTPEEMALYEKNGLAMETPQLQRYNLENAMVNPERNAHMGSYDVYPYHGTNDVITAPDYAFSGKGADQLGSAAIYTSKQPSLASGFTNPDISGGNVLPLALKNTNKYMSDELKKKLTPAQLREFITKSPDEYALSNFGDVGYEGKNKVINTAVQGYHQYGDEKLLDTLNSLNNDFYRGNPEEFNKLAGKLTKKAGVVMDTGENKIYAPWNTKDIRSKFAAFDPLRKKQF